MHPSGFPLSFSSRALPTLLILPLHHQLPPRVGPYNTEQWETLYIKSFDPSSIWSEDRYCTYHLLCTLPLFALSSGSLHSPRPAPSPHFTINSLPMWGHILQHRTVGNSIKSSRFSIWSEHRYSTFQLICALPVTFLTLTVTSASLPPTASRLILPAHNQFSPGKGLYNTSQETILEALTPFKFPFSPLSSAGSPHLLRPAPSRIPLPHNQSPPTVGSNNTVTPALSLPSPPYPCIVKPPSFPNICSFR